MGSIIEKNESKDMNLDKLMSEYGPASSSVTLVQLLHLFEVVSSSEK